MNGKTINTPHLFSWLAENTQDALIKLQRIYFFFVQKKNKVGISQQMFQQAQASRVDTIMCQTLEMLTTETITRRHQVGEDIDGGGKEGGGGGVAAIFVSNFITAKETVFTDVKRRRFRAHKRSKLFGYFYYKETEGTGMRWGGRSDWGRGERQRWQVRRRYGHSVLRHLTRWMQPIASQSQRRSQSTRHSICRRFRKHSLGQTQNAAVKKWILTLYRCIPRKRMNSFMVRFLG